jgi:hypothetical protein
MPSALAIVLVFDRVGSAAAQREASRDEKFRALEVAQKRQVLVNIIRHAPPSPPSDIEAVIRAALADADSTIREGALAAVVSRAAGQRFIDNARFADDWRADYRVIQSLRPEVVRALADPDEAVRVEAIAALASLDFVPSNGTVELSAASREKLIARFYTDEKPRVRAKIVAGFGTDQTHDPAQTRKVMLDAAKDSDFRVRSAAATGAASLGEEGLTLLVKFLGDEHRAVREQAALMLMKVGPAASAHVAEIDKAIQGEQDPTVKQRLKSA